MPKREVDKRKTRKALRKLRSAAERAGQGGAPELTTWEKDFVESVSKRLETYGSAFRDPGKGRLEEALSQRQHHVARIIEKKSRPKADKPSKGGKKADPKDAVFSGSSLKRKTPMRSRAAPSRSQGRGPRVRDVNDDMHEEAETPQTPAQKRAALRVIDGGKPPQAPPPKPR